MIKNTIKKCIIGALFLINYGHANAETKSIPGIFGAYITPGVSYCNLNSDDNELEVASKGGSFDLIGGVTYNHILTHDKAFYSVGLALGRETFSIEGNSVGTSKKEISETHELMYVYISPIGFTFNTDEVGILDLTAFLSVHGIAKLKLRNTCKGGDDGLKRYIKDFNIFGVDMNIRGGFKYAVGPSTSVSFGIDWYFGIRDVIASHEKLGKANVTGYSGRLGAYISMWF